jgi:hypothetical protein
MTNEQVMFTANASKEPTILRKRHRVIDEPRGRHADKYRWRKADK